MGRPWRYTLLALGALPRLLAAQLPSSIPPEPAADADLPTLAAWIERWLPVIGAASYPTIDSTADFYAYSSDSVTGARLEGCTLVLQERFVRTVRGKTLEKHRVVRVPLEQVDTAVVQPKIRQPQMLLTRPNVLLSGRLVVPLRSRTRTKFITVLPGEGAPGDTLVAEHLVPLMFAELPVVRSALALRRAAARCAELIAPRSSGDCSARPISRRQAARWKVN